MKIGVVQLRIEENPETNINKVNELTSQYEDTIFLLPELFTTGFNFELIKTLDESHIKLLEVLNENNIYMGSILRKEKNKFYNSFFIKDKKKINFIYDKIHLFPLMNEDKYFTAGDEYSIFDLNKITMGCAICFDLRFCDIFRNMRKNGARVIFLPAEWPRKRVEHLIVLSRARAIENQCYFVISNATGIIWEERFGGHSMIIDPWGKILKNAEFKEDVVLIDNIDLKLVDEVRNIIPMRG